jgi:protein SPT2
MALAQAQKSKILSPAAGFNTNQPGTLTLQRTLSNTAPARSRPPIPAKRGGSNSNSKVPTKNGSARERLLASFNPNETMKLNTDKRDTRTIDEIETDMRKKRSSLLPSTKAPTPLSHGHQNSRSVIPVTKGTTNPRSTASVASSSTRPITSASSSLNSKPSQSHNKRPRPSSRSSSSSDSQDDQSSRPSAVSQQIQLMFGRRDAKQYVDDYSDEDDDMEASNADVLKEEARAYVFISSLNSLFSGF